MQTNPLKLGSPCFQCGFVGDDAIFISKDGIVYRSEQENALIVNAHSPATVASFRPERNGVVIGCSDGAVIALADDGMKLHEPKEGCAVRAIACGKKLFACAFDHSIALYNSEARLGNIEHSRPVEGLAFSPDEAILAVAGEGEIVLYSIEMPVQVIQQIVWPGTHRSTLFSPDGRFIVSSMSDAQLRAWRLSDGSKIEMNGYVTDVESLSWSADGTWLATSGGPGAIVWSFAGESGPAGTVPTLVGHRHHGALVTRIACHPLESVICVAFDQGSIGIVHTIADLYASIRVRQEGQVTSLAWNEAGNRLAFGDSTGRAAVVQFD